MNQLVHPSGTPSMAMHSASWTVIDGVGGCQPRLKGVLHQTICRLSKINILKMPTVLMTQSANDGELHVRPPKCSTGPV